VDNITRVSEGENSGKKNIAALVITVETQLRKRMRLTQRKNLAFICGILYLIHTIKFKDLCLCKI
jgi:hypothetical protein